MRVFVLLAGLILLPLSAASAEDKAAVFEASEGMVPDEATAIRVAEAVWIPIYGERHVILLEPYMATLKDGGKVWEVTSIAQAAVTEGNVMARINKSDGRIMSISRGK